MKHRRLLAGGLIAVAIAIAALVGFVFMTNRSGNITGVSQSSAKAINAVGVDGRTLGLADFAGKPVVIGFVLDYCTTCVPTMRTLEQLADQGVATLALNVGAPPGTDATDAARRLKQFARGLDVTSPTMAADAGQRTAKRYNIRVLETFVILDGSGREIGRGTQLDAAAIEATLAKT
jgi:thiol-disulfide isomerase/thioredoxin